MEKKRTHTGAKAVQLSQKEDRTWRYRTKLRETPSCGLYCWDVDLVHVVFIDDKPVPVLITELTKAEPGKVITTRYRNAVLKRWYERDAQARFTNMVAKLLGVRAYLVLFTDELQDVHIYSFGAERWLKFTWQEHVNFFANAAMCKRAGKKHGTHTA